MSTIIETFGPKYLGRLPNGERVYVTGEVRQQEDNGRVRQTITHEDVTDPVEIAFQGYSTFSGHNSAVSGGQIVGTVREIDRPAPGVTLDQIREFADLWDRWHLNVLKAACAHQTVVYEDSPYGRRPSLTETLPCPETGYRYGTKWLVEPLPEGIIEQARAFFA